jgi:probable addiction module antidote protein
VTYLNNEEARAAYLAAALEDGDPSTVAAALGDIARAKGMTRVAEEAGLGRESLYKALSPTGNPELGTVLRVVQALGLKLNVVPSDGTP